MKTVMLVAALVVMVTHAALRAAAEQVKSDPVSWTGRALNGDVVSVPTKQTTTVLLFAMPDQARSRDAVAQLSEACHEQKGICVVLVVSGTGATDNARELLAATKEPWPVVADGDYSASGVFGVHVWPTTVFVDSEGATVAHVAGFPKSYKAEVEANLAVAQGKIDRARAEQIIGGHATIVDDPEQMISRHIIVAERMLEKELPDQAKKEAEAAVTLGPQSPKNKLDLARVLLRVGNVDQAVKLLDSVDAKSINPATLNLLRGEALAAQGKWDAAAKALAEAVKLNPQPAEAWYELGRVYEHLKQPAKAAEAYRNAFEATDLGKKLRGEPVR
jgi:tetratricopeptide (TPR) repeat protein